MTPLHSSTVQETIKSQWGYAAAWGIRTGLEIHDCARSRRLDQRTSQALRAFLRLIVDLACPGSEITVIALSGNTELRVCALFVASPFAASQEAAFGSCRALAQVLGGRLAEAAAPSRGTRQLILLLPLLEIEQTPLSLPVLRRIS